MTESYIPPEHEVARAAQRAVEDALAPCVPTRPGQGDDYGIDAYVQQVLRGRPLRRTALMFGLQVKGKSSELSVEHAEQLKVAHLIDWVRVQFPIVVAVHSVANAVTRWRFATDIVNQLDANSKDWRSQQTVSVQFGRRDEYCPDDLHDWIDRHLRHRADCEGGRGRFHEAIRSVYLTELYYGTVNTGQTFGISERPGGPAIGRCITGMQWQTGEPDERSVLASRSLSGALLLFDQVFYPAALTFAAILALGKQEYFRLLDAQRLIPVLHPEDDLAFVMGADNVGDLYVFNVDGEGGFQRSLKEIREKLRVGVEFTRRISTATRRVAVGARLQRELDVISKLPAVRDLLGLGHALPQSKEPPWSAERLLRIGNVAKHYSVGSTLGTDIVEFEPGLSRIALARWGSELQFHRVYDSFAELQRVFDVAALPDMGLVFERIGMAKTIEVAESDEGRNFREWFWRSAAEALEEQGALDNEIASRLRKAAGLQSPLPREFFVAMVEGSSGDEGLAARPGGEASLARQRHYSADRFRNYIKINNLEMPLLGEPCLCGSGRSFSSCCGRILLRSQAG